jgi:hypothetical protein
VPLNALRQRRKSPMRDHSAVVLPPRHCRRAGNARRWARADNSGFAKRTPSKRTSPLSVPIQRKPSVVCAIETGAASITPSCNLQAL